MNTNLKGDFQICISAPLKTSPNIVGDKHVGICKFQLLNSEHFLMNRKGTTLIKEFIEG